MSGLVTLTGTAGPAITATAVQFTDVTIFTVETERSMITLVRHGRTVQIAIDSATTVTATKSGTSWTLTIS